MTAQQREAAAKQDADNRARWVAEAEAQITVRIPAKPDRVAARVLSAFVENQLSVSSTQTNLIEAKLPRETTLMGSYDIVARAIIVPMDTATQVTLLGEETKLAQGLVPQRTTRVNEWSGGRAKQVWTKLRAIARSLEEDSTLKSR